MTDSEPIPYSSITHEKLSLIPDRRKEFYTRDTLPKADVILRALYQKEELDKN